MYSLNRTVDNFPPVPKQSCATKAWIVFRQTQRILPLDWNFASTSDVIKENDRAIDNCACHTANISPVHSFVRIAGTICLRLFRLRSVWNFVATFFASFVLLVTRVLVTSRVPSKF